MSKTVTQARSRSAILGYLAAAAAARKLTDRPGLAAWLGRMGLGIGEGGLRDALSLRLMRHGAPLESADDPSQVAWIREALDFDAMKLDLDLALVVLPPSEDNTAALEALRRSERMVRVYRGYDRDLVALLAYDGAQDRQALQAFVEEQSPHLRWIVIREVDDTPARDTWLALARRVAGQEGFLSD